MLFELDSAVIGANIRRFRRLAGLSQSSLGEKLFLTQTQIYRYEKGINYPPVDILQKMAVIFGVSVYDLLYDDVLTELVPIDVTDKLKADLESDDVFVRTYAESALKQGHTSIWVMLSKAEKCIYDSLKTVLPSVSMPDISLYAEQCGWKKYLQQKRVGQV